MSENTHTPAPHRVTVEVGGRTLTLETGKIAKQANGAIVAHYGDTGVLTTACMASTANDRDFLPLTVDYRENTYSAGKIPGGFFKREGRPSEKEVLTSRLIDRPMRPLFPESWRNETQIVSMVLSADSENDPDVIAVTSASAAAYCSDLPFEKPIYKDLQKKYGDRLHDAVNTEKHPKKESYHLIDALKEEIIKTIPEEPKKEMDEKRTLTKRAFERLREEIFRD